MATFSSEFFKQKLVRKNLVLELDEDDDILGSIKQGMKSHKVKEASIAQIEGTIKIGKMAAVIGSNYKAIPLNNTPVHGASGHFKLSFDELFGSLHVLAKTPKLESGTLQRGNASAGLKITLNFYIEQKVPTEKETSLESTAVETTP